MNHDARIEQVKQELVEQDKDALLATGSANTYYFSGFHTHSDGDYPLVLIPQEGDATLFVGGLDEDAAVYASTIDVTVPENKFTDAVVDAVDEDAELLVEQSVNVGLYNKLDETLDVETTKDLVSDIRAVKDTAEVDLIRQAYQLTEQAVQETVKELQTDVSEKQVAADLEHRMRKEGSMGTPFPTIIATGASSSMPHHSTGDTAISDGPLLFDVGATLQGYNSDLSRTFHIGQPDDQFKELYETVRQAQQAAAETLQPGISAADVDAAARDAITDAGHEDAFKHSTGHGVGIEVHEAPNLSPRSEDTVLEEGMVVTIEPGIYIKGEFGIRIEDAYHVTENGAERLTESSRELKIINPD